MRVSREKTKQTHDRILDAASRLFREQGIAAVGVDAVMQAAGLSHGGFYRHFPSKDALAAAALGHALDQTLSAQAAYASLDEVVSAYLSAEHRAAPGEGCAIAALGPEVARLDGKARATLTENVKAQIDRLAALQPEGTAEPRQRAVATLAGLVGALVLARAVDDVAVSDEILEATHAVLLG